MSAEGLSSPSPQPMSRTESTAPIAPDARWTRFVPCPDRITKAHVYYISCVMPESHQTQLREFPQPGTREKDTMYILVVAGNLSKYAGDLFDAIILELHKIWDFIVYVPGPYEYAHGTMELGDDYTRILASADHRMIFLGTGDNATRCVYFAGPRLLLIGAPLWPVDPELYKVVSVYEESGNVTDPTAARRAVEDRRPVRGSLLRFRAMRDTLDLVKTLDGRKDPHETRIVVSYGCPDPQLSADVNPKKALPEYNGTIVPDKALATKVIPRIHRWIYGANGNMGAIHRIGNVLYHRNQYSISARSFETPHPIVVTAGDKMPKEK